MRIQPRTYKKEMVLSSDIMRPLKDPKQWFDQVDNCQSNMKTGEIVPNMNAAGIALLHHPLLKGCLGYSVLDECVMIMRPLPCCRGEIPPNGTGRAYPRRLDDDDLIWIMKILNFAFAKMSGEFKKNIVDDAIKIAAHQQPYNPIEEYLKSTEWDGVARLDKWLNKSLGAAPTELNEVLGTKFLIGSVRRATKRDGHKFDSMLVLEGPKGINKSSICRALFGSSYFMEGIGSLKSPGLAEKLSGIWGVEIPELQGFKNQDPQLQKEFLSKMSDTFRRPYLRHPSTYPRRCVFIGTVNDNQYIQEKGTDRRFWCVRCNEIGTTDIEWLRANRNQLWAEAYAVAQSETLDYLTHKEMEMLGEIQVDREAIDPWEGIIAYWLHNAGKDLQEYHMNHVLTNVLNIPVERQDRSASIKVGNILTSLGLKKKRIRHNGSLTYIYVNEG